jgi:hypothetical protein
VVVVWSQRLTTTLKTVGKEDWPTAQGCIWRQIKQTFTRESPVGFHHRRPSPPGGGRRRRHYPHSLIRPAPLIQRCAGA